MQVQKRPAVSYEIHTKPKLFLHIIDIMHVQMFLWLKNPSTWSGCGKPNRCQDLLRGKSHEMMSNSCAPVCSFLLAISTSTFVSSPLLPLLIDVSYCGIATLVQKIGLNDWLSLLARWSLRIWIYNTVNIRYLYQGGCTARHHYC
jgi:hypothetical protein